jgi:autotransporter-associated beta strand protein
VDPCANSEARRVRRRSSLLTATVPLAAALFASAAGAGTNQYFDGDGIAPINTASGLWNLTDPHWSTDPAGSNYTVWDNSGNVAVFNGGGLIQTNGDVIASGLDFRGGDYSIVQLGGSLTLDTFDFANPPTIKVDAGHSVQFPHSAFGTSGFTKTGGGTVYFERQLTSGGMVNINEGTVAFSLSAADFLTGHAMKIGANGTFNMGVVNDGFGSLAGSGTVQTTPILVGGAFGGPQLTVGGDGSDTVFSGTLAGEGGQFFKTGTGTMTLSGANEFEGRYGVSEGTLRVEGGQAIGDKSDVFLTPTAGLIATLDIGTSERMGSLGSSGTAAAVVGNGNTITIGSDITPNIQYNGRIEEGAGTGTKVIKVGKGLQQFTTAGNASTYTGGTEVREGALLVSGDAKLGASGTRVTLDGGTLENFNTVGLNLARPFTIGANGGRIQVNNNPNFASYTSGAQLTMTVSGVVDGAGVLAKSGPGRLTLSNSANTFGGLTVDEGSVFTGVNTGTPFGSGPVRMNGGELIVQPANAGADVAMTVASATGASYSYGDGTRLQLNRNSNTSLSLTAGPSGATSSSLVHLPGGSMVLIPFSGVSNLGNPGVVNKESFFVNGDVPVRNGIVDPSIVSWTSGGGSAGEYLTYSHDNGFQQAIYNGNDLNAAAATDVIKTAGAQTLAADKAVYALNTAHTIDGAALRLGDGSGSAGLIMNIGARISTSGLTFDGDEAAIYTQNTASGIIDAPVTVTHGGLTKFGLGTVQLNAPATYTGPTVIGTGTLAIGTTDALPTTTALRFGGFNSFDAGNTNTANTRLTLALNGNNQTVGSLSSINHLATVDLGGGKLTVNQTGDTIYRGRIIGGGTFEKSGPGKLVLNPIDNNSISDGIFASNYNQLVVSGGTLEFANFGSMPALPTDYQPDLITLSNGGTLRWAGLNTLTTSQSTFTSVNIKRGVTLGQGGGTIDVANPYEILIWHFKQGDEIGGQIFTGPGGLTKKGPGFLRLGAGNTYEGKTSVLEGNLQFTNDTALGKAPDTFVADQLFIDNGSKIESNASGWISATRGIKIGAGGAVVWSNSGSWIFNSVISGPGAITRAGNSSATATNFNADNNTFNGITLLQGQTFFNGNQSAGSGAITINPLTQVTIGKNEGPDNTISNPIQLGAGAPIDIRVNTGASAFNNSIFNGVPIGNLTLAGKISGPGTLFMGLGGVIPNGDGTVILNNSTSDFTGEFGIYQGIVQLDANNTLGSTTGSTTLNYQGTLAFNNVQYTTPERLSVSGTGLYDQGALRGIAGTSKFAGPVHITGDTKFDVEPSASLELAGTVTGTSALTKVGDGKLILSGAGNTWTGDTSLQAGSIDFASDHHIGRLVFSTGTTATLTTGKRLLRTTGVQFNDPVNPDARLDLTNGRLIVDYADGSGTQPMIDTRNAIIAGYVQGTGPHWTGNGITSSSAAANGSLAIGYAEASEITSPSGGAWTGENVDGSAVLVRTTLSGDATLDGAVNFNDLVKLAQNYNTQVSSTTESWWNHGDFTYDGMVDFNDLVKLAQNYNTALPTEPIPGAPAIFEADLARAFASVPEPSVALLAFFGACGVAVSRRRRLQK